MEDSCIVFVVAMFLIAAIEITALIILGIDGPLLSGTVATLTGLALKYKDLRMWFNGRTKPVIRDNSGRNASTC